MSKKDTVRVKNPDGTWQWISPAKRDELLANGELVPYFEERNGKPHHIGYAREEAHGQSNRTSPASLTESDTLAALGLSRFSERPEGVSASREFQAQMRIMAHGNAHRSCGLTDAQKEMVDAELKRGRSARQAAVNLALTKSYVDAYVQSKNTRPADLTGSRDWRGVEVTAG